MPASCCRCKTPWPVRRVQGKWQSDVLANHAIGSVTGTHTHATITPGSGAAAWRTVGWEDRLLTAFRPLRYRSAFVREAAPELTVGVSAWTAQAVPRPWPSGIQLGLLLVMFGSVWLVELAATSLSPPVDNIEQLTWVRSLEWGYYKHPPLPTWLLWLPAEIFGLSSSVTYVLGATLTLGALGLLWRILRNRRSAQTANLVLLGSLCVTFYNGRLYYYNHNIVLLRLSRYAPDAACGPSSDDRWCGGRPSEWRSEWVH